VVTLFIYYGIRLKGHLLLDHIIVIQMCKVAYITDYYPIHVKREMNMSDVRMAERREMFQCCAGVAV